MSITFSGKTEPITNRRKVGDVGLIGASSISGILRDTTPVGEHAARGAGNYMNRNIPTAIEGSALMLENLERLGSKDPFAVALASVVARSECPFLTPSATRDGLTSLWATQALPMHNPQVDGVGVRRPQFNLQKLLEWAEEFSEFLHLTSR